MSEILTGLCPNCGSKLNYEKKETTVMCYACDSSIRVSELSIGAAGGAMPVATGAFAAFMGFDNPESGVVFLENFFETYDWLSYQQTPDLTIPEITEVIGNNKVKNGAVPETWYLDFMGLYVPVSKKFEALDLLSDEIREKFNPNDASEAFRAFDQYCSIATVLLREREAIFKSLSSAIKFAERFSLDAEKLSQMKSGITVLQNAYTKIATTEVAAKDGSTVAVVIKAIEEHPAYVAARDEYAAINKDRYLANGIDAEDVYTKAVAAYKDGNRTEALSLFESIRDYSDSSLYIQRINRYFGFYGELYHFADKYFIYKRETVAPATLNVKDPSQPAGGAKPANGTAQDTVTPVTALSLYEVIDGVPAEKPTIAGIDRIITCYGNKLFYFKTGKGISCYDVVEKTETTVDVGTPDQYRDASGQYNITHTNCAPVFAVRKANKKPVQPEGCLKKSQQPQTPAPTTYSLIVVNMSTSTASPLVNEMVDIKFKDGCKVFYTCRVAPAPAKGAKVNPADIKTQLMVCDIASGEVKKVLDEDCELHAVHNNYIIYTLWVPNEYNEDLHVYDLESGTDTLIENNIYDFFGVYDGMLYYTVGNSEFRPLVRNTFDGTHREQIMRDVVAIEDVRAGWFYVTKGKGYNKVLMKISTDGKTHMPLCTAIHEIIRFEGNYVYYTDVFGALRVVRIDGKENRVIAPAISKIFPDKDGLYYCREERVSASEKALSLYKMDRDGMNIQKIVFNVDRVKNDDETDTIYYSKAENVRFKVYQPKHESQATYQFFKLTRFYKFKKASADGEATKPELILTLGLPKSNAQPGGCLSSKPTVDFVYEEAPIVHSYKTRGKSDQQITEEETKAAPSKPASSSGWLSTLLGI